MKNIYLIVLVLIRTAVPEIVDCTDEELQNMEIELPKYVNENRGKMAKGGLQLKNESDNRMVNYKSATNMQEVKWSNTALEVAVKQLQAYRKNLGLWETDPGAKNANGKTYFISYIISADGCESTWKQFATENVAFPVVSNNHHDKKTYWKVRMATLKNWAAATEIGCAVIKDIRKSDSFTLVYCAHGPIDDYENGIVYEEGEPCSNCPDGTICDERKLCVEGSQILMTKQKPRTIQKRAITRKLITTTTTTTTTVVTLPTTQNQTRVLMVERGFEKFEDEFFVSRLSESEVKRMEQEKNTTKKYKPISKDSNYRSVLIHFILTMIVIFNQ